MTKQTEIILETANKILPVIIALFVLLTVYVWITTAPPWKRVNAAKGKQIESAADLGLENEMESRFEDEGQTYSAIKGFKVSADNTKKGSTQTASYGENTDEEILDDESTDEENTADADEFAFPNSYKERLTAADVRSLTTKAEVQDAINYIYARTGCMFRDDEKRAYYEQFDWYEGRYYVDEMNENPLNYMTELQHDNIELLAQRRNELNE